MDSTWVRLIILLFSLLLLSLSLLSTSTSLFYYEQAQVQKQEQSSSSTTCYEFQYCGSCTTARFDFDGPTCLWYADDNYCAPKDSNYFIEQESTNEHPTKKRATAATPSPTTIFYEFDCPLGPIPYQSPPDFLQNWMGHFLNGSVWEQPYKDDDDDDGDTDHKTYKRPTTLIDLSLPGTHDSMTYDLSQIISEDGLDNYHELQDILHKLSVHILPGDLEDFFRMQAKTQQLTISQQLDNGIRFIDFRIMFENDDWYCIHFMQTRGTVKTYLQQIRDWLHTHPSEVIIIFLSQHGNPQATGEDQFPQVSQEAKDQFWNMYLDIFHGILQDTTQTSIFTTPIQQLIQQHNHRVVTFAADYNLLTKNNSSFFAYNAQAIQNTYDNGGGIFGNENIVELHNNYFKNAHDNNQNINNQQGYTLFAMNTAVTSWQTLHSAQERFLHFGISSCSSKIKKIIPDWQTWCPQTLLDIAQLANYYNQISMEYALHYNYSFPNAFYIDALDVNGTIRTGTQLLDSTPRRGQKGDDDNNNSAMMDDTKYAFVDTVLEYNLRRSSNCDVSACISTSSQANQVYFKNNNGEYQHQQTVQQRRLTKNYNNQNDFVGNNGCCELFRQIKKRKQRYPMKLWDDHYHGRHTDWPPLF